MMSKIIMREVRTSNSGELDVAGSKVFKARWRRGGGRGIAERLSGRALLSAKLDQAQVAHWLRILAEAHFEKSVHLAANSILICLIMFLAFARPFGRWSPSIPRCPPYPGRLRHSPSVGIAPTQQYRCNESGR